MRVSQVIQKTFREMKTSTASTLAEINRPESGQRTRSRGLLPECLVHLIYNKVNTSQRCEVSIAS